MRVAAVGMGMGVARVARTCAHARCATRRHLSTKASAPSSAHVRGDSSTIISTRLQHIRVVSGIQPTGGMHLGNYFGAIQQWVRLQDNFQLHPLGQNADPDRNGNNDNHNHNHSPSSTSSSAHPHSVDPSIASSSSTSSSSSSITTTTTSGPLVFSSKSLLSIVDLHALTTLHPKSTLADDCLNLAKIYLACGIDPRKSSLFVQSSVAGHSELNWILSCITPLGWLERMTQFKDKSKKSKSELGNAPYGLLAYPVLMASDILLYRATHVPVGNDQVQHLELARDLAQLFNHRFKTDYFPIPEYLLGQGARVMSLRDGTVKMSKSDPSAASRIHLVDTSSEIQKKIRSATTDAIEGVSYDPQNRPHLANLVNIFSLCTGENIDSICSRYAHSQKSQFKSDLADAIVNVIDPIRSEYDRISADEQYVYDVLKQGGNEARERAEASMTEIRKLVGMLPLL